MRVSGFPLDLSWLLQFISTTFIIALGLLYLVKNTASKYFMVDASFEPSDPASPSSGGKILGSVATSDSCVVCGNSTKKQCSGCKLVRYCSEKCQRFHWNSGHKAKCKDFQVSGKVNPMQSASMQHGRRGSCTVALVPACGTTGVVNQAREILFPYEEFLQLFNWNRPGLPPCGLLNCGNSCFANVVLQCLAYTRPLVAYLLEKGHRRECRRNDWCFLCEFQSHIERASESRHPFSPINILSRLPNIGGNLGYGKQEDAHEFMRFAIDTMQLVCLDEFGGEKAIHPSTQETTLIQHIFGGHLQSQVICAKCNNISSQCENMMDLTVEIHGDAASLEECLDQFTVKEELHGDNMYKCDGCNDYVMAWKRLTIRRAPNILTIALKRFQSGRFGKLNKRVTFPETLDLRPYMSEAGDGNDIYKLYAVVVHVDMLNASFFGHYICYTKDFCGNWYRIDDCKVARADLDEVLSQGAYMLLYSRICARPTCLQPIGSVGKEKESAIVVREEPCAKQLVECLNTAGSTSSICSSGSTCEKDLSPINNSEDVREDMEIDSESSLSGLLDVATCDNGCSLAAGETVSSVANASRLVSGVVSSINDTCNPKTYSPDLITSKYVDQDNNEVVRSAKTFIDSSSESSPLLLNSNGLTGPSNKSTLPMQNCASEKGEMLYGSSVGLNSELSDAKNAIDPNGEPTGREVRMGLLSSSCAEGEIIKLSGRNSSGAKLKPLFAPGFLGNRPGRKPMKRDEKAPIHVSESADSFHLNKSIGFLRPYQNGANIGKTGERHFDSDILSPHTGEQVRNKLPNGDCGAFGTSDLGSIKIGMEDHPLENTTLDQIRELKEKSETNSFQFEPTLEDC